MIGSGTAPSATDPDRASRRSPAKSCAALRRAAASVGRANSDKWNVAQRLETGLINRRPWILQE
jgi:hypothetical protein